MATMSLAMMLGVRAWPMPSSPSRVLVTALSCHSFQFGAAIFGASHCRKAAVVFGYQLRSFWAMDSSGSFTSLGESSNVIIRPRQLWPSGVSSPVLRIKPRGNMVCCKLLLSVNRARPAWFPKARNSWSAVLFRSIVWYLVPLGTKSSTTTRQSLVR